LRIVAVAGLVAFGLRLAEVVVLKVVVGAACGWQREVQWRFFPGLAAAAVRVLKIRAKKVDPCGVAWMPFRILMVEYINKRLFVLRYTGPIKETLRCSKSLDPNSNHGKIIGIVAGPTGFTCDLDTSFRVPAVFQIRNAMGAITSRSDFKQITANPIAAILHPSGHACLHLYVFFWKVALYIWNLWKFPSFRKISPKVGKVGKSGEKWGNHKSRRLSRFGTIPKA
jgi:hypothetical protein